MKAYIIGLKSDSDVGNEIVFAENSKEARKLADSVDLTESRENYIDVTVHRYSLMDDKENLSQKEQMTILWREGWWFFQGDCPSADDDVSDDVFHNWYDKTYK